MHYLAYLYIILEFSPEFSYELRRYTFDVILGFRYLLGLRHLIETEACRLNFFFSPLETEARTSQTTGDLSKVYLQPSVSTLQYLRTSQTSERQKLNRYR